MVTSYPVLEEEYGLLYVAYNNTLAHRLDVDNASRDALHEYEIELVMSNNIAHLAFSCCFWFFQNHTQNIKRF